MVTVRLQACLQMPFENNLENQNPFFCFYPIETYCFAITVFVDVDLNHKDQGF